MPIPSDSDITAYSDQELRTLRQKVIEETVRRDELDMLPSTIEAATQRFVDQGGDKAKIRPPQSYTRNPKA